MIRWKKRLWNHQPDRMTSSRLLDMRRRQKNMDKSNNLKPLPTFPILLALLSSCGSPSTRREAQNQQPSEPAPTAASTLPAKEAELATRRPLAQVDDYPLLTMRYVGAFPGRTQSHEATVHDPLISFLQTSCSVDWGCSLFTAEGDQGDRILGRNFDWRFSPALLLFITPEDGYASVSMMDIEYLGLGGERDQDLTDLPLEDLQPPLDAPPHPFDGMNEKGLAVAMASDNEQAMPFVPAKNTIDQVEGIREILDHAGTVDEAIEIFDRYNIDMGSVPIHYMVSSATGKSAVVEFYQGEMVVFWSKKSWQAATNFLLASANGKEQGLCWPIRWSLVTWM